MNFYSVLTNDDAVTNKVSGSSSSIGTGAGPIKRSQRIRNTESKQKCESLSQNFIELLNDKDDDYVIIDVEKNYCKASKSYFENPDFTSLQESALESLLGRDDLQVEEVKIWDYVIKWGISQNPTLPKNLEEWPKDDFLTLKTTSQQFLPLIRYFHISNAEIIDKVSPYKMIPDKQLYIKQHIAVPDRPVRSVLATELPPRIRVSKKSFSTIISEEHVAEISIWIGRETATYSIQI
ncbi:hypothetical protein Glove_67g111 [Diversispora epigaea]|uniref:BACK domain-containing protein n=1 Tax=Diversispora epigaea TaxID=1348612 RepID=A0A397JA97_9GLOM|nr:hypothetical protein Glove_67g111 [Diversispora epigaea]